MPRRLFPQNLGEASESSIVRMSNEAMIQTKMKNEHERWKFLKELRQLLSDEKLARLHSRRELNMLREEYTKMLAYGVVYKEHGFRKYDRPVTTKDIPKVDKALPSLSRQTSILPDISDAPSYIRTPTKRNVTRSHSDVSDMKQTDVVCPRRRLLSVDDSNLRGDISYTADVVNDEAKRMEPVPEESPDSADPNEDEKKITSALSTIFAIKLQALIMWKQKIQILPNRAVSERPRFVRQKTMSGETPHVGVVRDTRTRPHSLFPGDCKTVFGMKRFLEREVTNKIIVLSSPKKDKAKLDKMIEGARLPQLIERRKTTSAIFRDFRLYKESLRNGRDRDEVSGDNSEYLNSSPNESNDSTESK